MNQNTEHLSDEAFAQSIIHGARSIQPDAAFASQLEQKLTSPARPAKPKISMQHIIRLFGGVAAIFILAFIAIVNVPSLRAIAEEIIGLLTRSTRDETTGYYMEQPPVQMFASLEKAEADLSRNFVVPQYLPSITRVNKVIPVEFQMLYYTPEIKSVRISYRFTLNSLWELSFTQAPAESYVGRTFVGASAEVEAFTFNFRGQPVSAQFVNGGWVPKRDAERPVVEMQQAGEATLETATPPPVELEWSTENGDMYLIWEADGVVYHFYTRESNMLEINRDELIRIAESIE